MHIIVSNPSYSYTAAGRITTNVNPAKNAAGLGIDESAKAQWNGLQAGTKNAQDGQSVLQVADGALSNVTDMLQRMRELAISAGNPTYTDQDKQLIQGEIDALKQGISDITKNTEFNTKKVFDGSMSDAALATNPDGSGMTMRIESISLQNLGIADFDVTGEFSIDAIDNAISLVNKSRGTSGAQSNALDSVIAYNQQASENLHKFTSELEDVDAQQYISDRNKEKLLGLYQMYSQKMDMNSQENLLTTMFGR